jgi:S-adenosyl methyltransferase
MTVCVPRSPVLDAGRITRLRDVLAGGHLALEADRRLAALVLERWPRTASLVRAANDFHRRSACWAVTGGTPGFRVPPAAGVIFAACGYPLPGGFHATAAAARPDALFAYADPDPAAIMYNLARLHSPDPGHVSAIPGSARDPAGLLSAGQATEMLERGPVMVQLQLCAHWWPGDFAAWAVAEYARLLPSGSTLALSLAVPGGGSDAGALAAAIGSTAGTVQAHTEDEVARWVTAAGLDLTPAGVADVRGRELGWAAAEFGRQRPAARVIEAVAVVP